MSELLKTLITKLNFWQLLLILVILISPFILLILKGFSFKYKDKELKSNSRFLKKSKKTSEIKKHHHNCPYVYDMVLIVTKVTETKDEIDRILYFSRLREQKRYAKERVLFIKSIMSKKYFEALEAKCKKENIVIEIISSNNYKNYSYLLDLLETQILEYMALSFEENHFDQLSDLEFEKYISQKFQLYYKLSYDFFNTRFSDSILSREELHMANKECGDELKRQIEDIYKNALKISLKCLKSVDKLSTDLNNLLKEIGLPDNL